jgi:PPOX class probable F420-dependent enzyme
MLEDRVRSLARGKNFAALTTLLPGGQAMTHVMWVDAEDDYILMNTEVHRQKFKNVRRDPRVTVTIIDSADPYKYVEVRGRVAEVVKGPQAREHIDQLSNKYLGRPYNQDDITSERVILRIVAERQRAKD